MSKQILDAAQLTDAAMLWPTPRRTILGHGVIQTFVNDDIMTPDGHLMRRQYAQHPGAVGILAWDDDDTVALVRQYRHPVGSELIELPAGVLDHKGEDPLAAAQRELAEEVLLAADQWQVLSDLLSTPGATQEALRIYLARSLRDVPRPAGFVLEGEEAEMGRFWAKREDLLAAIFAGKVQNPSLTHGLLALEYARANGLLEQLRPGDAPWPIRESIAAQTAIAEIIIDG
jgi:ADP-ribose pyrophosphatase